MWYQSQSFRRTTQIVLLTFAILALMGAGDDESRFQGLGHRMMCVCGCGQILLECNHVGCQYSDKMRNDLQAALERGDSDDQILQGFMQSYGPTIVASPTMGGFNYVAWVAPFLVLALGTGFVVFVVKS